MRRRTASTLFATVIAALALTSAAGAATRDRYVNPPRSASINSADFVPLEVDPGRFEALTTTVAESRWGLRIDGPTMATPGARDDVNAIGFTSALPRDVLGAYIFWPRR